MSEKWKKWFKAAGIRALRTMAQALIVGIGTAVVMADVDWHVVISSVILQGIVSMAMSVKGLPELETTETK